MSSSPESPATPEPSASVPPAVAAASVEDLAEALTGVEVALARLDAGTYWTCEVTGEPLPDELLVADPLARRLPERPATSW